jgi:IS5 family transposase
MGRRRYRDTGQESFFGELAYEAMLKRHPRHFLVALERLFDWEAMSEQMIRLYKGRGEVGRPPYAPALVLKMLFLSYLYDVSERMIVELADMHLLIKWFLGLALDAAPPDHTTLTVFKNRLLEGENKQVLVDLFDGMITQARAYGLQPGELQVLDSVHTQANVNAQKDRERQERGGKPRDPEARVVHKGRRQVTEPDGTTTMREMRYRGYKSHVSVNAETGVVTSVLVTPGNAADNKAFPQLREHDRTLNLPTRAYGGDKAYDDTEIYERLAAEGLEVAVTLNAYRTAKKDANRTPWLELVADERYQMRNKQRYRVEQPSGTNKLWQGFGRCRYLGLARYRIQALLTFMVHNAKRLIKLLTGVTFRPQAKGRRAEPLIPVLAAIP